MIGQQVVERVVVVDVHAHRDARLDRAMFYLLWQGGLRKGEVEELRLEDLDISGKRLTVRHGKGMKDRTVYLTETTIRALEAYLVVRGIGPSDHVFLYRNQALSKDLIQGRLKLAARRTGVNVSAHRLRHTCATQLLNAGCRVTSIQKLMGHKKLNSTMIYARVHDQTVADDYFAAMRSVEQRVGLVGQPVELSQAIQGSEREQALALAEQLAQPEIGREERLNLVMRLKLVLAGDMLAYQVMPVEVFEARPLDHSPPLASV